MPDKLDQASVIQRRDWEKDAGLSWVIIAATRLGGDGKAIVRVWRIISVAAAIAVWPPSMLRGAEAKQVLKAAIELDRESWLYQGLEEFKKSVEKKSAGEIEIEISPSTHMKPGEDIRIAVSSGKYQLGAGLLSGFAEDVPAVNIFSQPFMFFSKPMLKASTAPQSPMRLLIEQAIIQSHGERVLWWQAAGATVFLSKANPVLLPTDIAGKTVQISIAALGEMVRLCGGKPVDAPSEGHGLTASADMAIVPIANAAEGTTSEAMKTLTVTHHIVQEYLVVINEFTWTNLTSDQRRLVQEAATETEQLMDENIKQDEEENIELAAKRGMKVAEITADQVAAWKACATPMLEAYLQRSGSLGPKLMDAYRRIIVDIYRKPSH